MPKITEIQTIRTRVNGAWLFVKILTDQPGLYGIGSASDHFRCRTVQTAVETIAPMLIGRDASQIEDIWQAVYTSGYWRNDSIINTAQAGIDMALWDIKGKEAGMPVYKLLGGACRSAVMAYAHAGGDTVQELEDDVRRYMEESIDSSGFIFIKLRRNRVIRSSISGGNNRSSLRVPDWPRSMAGISAFSAFYQTMNPAHRG